MTDVITEKLERESLDIAEDRIAKLREDFPEVFRDGKIDFDTLKRALGEHVEPENERFGLQWPGKAAAFQAVQTPSVATLLPDPDNSVDWDTTQNLIIEGDNLEVLKLLQKSYYGKVKMIYIDPPYNTGNDFIYPDNYREGLQSYLEFTGQVSAEGKKLTTNTESGGRYHSNWLNMMYPRLYLARNLLRDDGLIFVSIDDAEVSRLRSLLDEVFGEENFIDNIIWKKRYGGGPKEKHLVTLHEYALLYAKDINSVPDIMIPLTEEMIKRYYTSTDANSKSRGPYRTHPLEATKSMGARPNLVFPIPAPDGTLVRPRRQWLWSKERVAQALERGELEFLKGRDGQWSVHTKQYLTEEDGTQRKGKAQSIIDDVYTQHGTNEMLELFGDAQVFPFPKPSGFLQRLLRMNLEPMEEGIVLDFFAGSGSTAHAVMQQNAEDGGNRRSILVQLPEPIDPPKELSDGTVFSTIADITRERVRRAGKKIASDNPNVDIGFRAYKLSTSNFTPWDGTPPDAKQGKLDLSLPETAQKIARQLEAFTENVVPDRTQEDLLTEILLRLGYDLTVTVERLAISGHTVFSVANGAILACLESSLTLDLFEEMAQRDPGQIVCLDSAFGDDDELKVNAVQVIRSRARSEEATIKLWLV